MLLSHPGRAHLSPCTCLSAVPAARVERFFKDTAEHSLISCFPPPAFSLSIPCCFTLQIFLAILDYCALHSATPAAHTPDLISHSRLLYLKIWTINTQSSGILEPNRLYVGSGVYWYMEIHRPVFI